jgi:TolA-binding protein
MSRFLALFFILPIMAFSAEPSVYGAGNLDSDNPYGLSPSEKKIVQNSKTIKSLEKRLRILQFKYSDLQEKLDGTRSVTQSISDKIGMIDGKIREVNMRDSNKTDSIQSLRTDLDSLKEQFNENLTIQSENQAKIKSVLSELSSLIDSINSNYVTKDEFNKLLATQNKILKKISGIKKRNIKSSLSKKSGAQLLKEAENYLSKKAYDKAKIRYERLIKIGYKPARSNFKLGEIAYRKKQYKKAIIYYKKSIALYENASYTPTLLYHTGVSLSKLKKSKEASKFFQVLKSNYPDSKEAKSLK